MSIHVHRARRAGLPARVARRVAYVEYNVFPTASIVSFVSLRVTLTVLVVI